VCVRDREVDREREYVCAFECVCLCVSVCEREVEVERHPKRPITTDRKRSSSSQTS